MKEHLRNESCFRQHYSLARNLSTSMGGFTDTYRAVLWHLNQKTVLIFFLTALYFVHCPL